MTQYAVITPNADVRETPDTDVPKGKFETQLVSGEIFVVELEKGNWCKGYCAHDKYPGWVEKRFLRPAFATTHVVTAARSQVYKDATMKSACLGTVSFGSRVQVMETGDGYARLSSGTWIYAKHLSPVAATDSDHLATAKKFIETPYYWGGRSGFGIDCSGLVQVCLGRAGVEAPRDTEQQITLGTSADRPRTGDLVFFKGHVGILADADNLLHANAFHMKVNIEPLWEVDVRAKGVTAIRRI